MDGLAAARRFLDARPATPWGPPHLGAALHLLLTLLRPCRPALVAAGFLALVLGISVAIRLADPPPAATFPRRLRGNHQAGWAVYKL